ncbi:MAG: rhodanese-like domain-containing protein [Spirochaetales bacterium]|nr:rhodanese-like domain-containing protein [Spirochaetales bacterium]
MKKICLALFILILSSSCIFSKGEGYKRISMDEAKTLMEKKEGYILLDVRTKGEYESGYIPGAINIPLSDIDEKIISFLPDKSQMILVYCRSGNRSREASDKLSKLGYSNVLEIGGINAWKGEIVKNKSLYQHSGPGNPSCNA